MGFFLKLISWSGRIVLERFQNVPNSIKRRKTMWKTSWVYKFEDILLPERMFRGDEAGLVEGVWLFRSEIWGYTHSPCIKSWFLLLLVCGKCAYQLLSKMKSIRSWAHSSKFFPLIFFQSRHTYPSAPLFSQHKWLFWNNKRSREGSVGSRQTGTGASFCLCLYKV